MRATATRLSFWAASVYLALGLLSGLFTREFTRGGEFESFSSTQLGTTHTHMLVLGFIMMLIVLLTCTSGRCFGFYGLCLGWWDGV